MSHNSKDISKLLLSNCLSAVFSLVGPTTAAYVESISDFG